MSDTDYLLAAEALLADVEAACDRINDATDADLDNQRVGGMITLTLPNRSQIVINLQKPLQEVWLAARDGGYHYRLQSGCWLDSKSGEEFWATLSRCASDQTGLSLTFRA